jgi:hypothetical protein
MPDGDKKSPRRPASARPLPGGPAASAEEAPWLCPECQAPCASIELHLRQAHRIYQFRGTRRSLNDTLGVLLTLLLQARPDPEAWDVLAGIARDDHKERGDFYLASLLGEGLERLEPPKRAAAEAGLGQTLAASRAVRLIAVLASDDADASRRVALAALARLPPPIPTALHQPLRGLLLDRRLPADEQMAATATLVRGAGADRDLARDFLRTLVTGLGKARSIERLRELEQTLGPTPAIDDLCAQFEDQLRMACPRCGVELVRPEMLQHLWLEHKLVLDGRRVRDPWAIIEEWLDLYRSTGNAELVERCRIVGQRVEGDAGVLRVQRLLIARGADEPEVRRALLEEARDEHASRCPWCFALVPVPHEAEPAFVNQYRGRLSARGYRVEIDEGRQRTLLEVEKPDRLLVHGSEPGHRWTARAASTFFTAPFVLLGLALAVGLMSWDGEVYWPVSGILLVAAVVYGLARRAWRAKVPAEDRARNYAWTLLAPRLHEGGFRLDDSAFLAGLAHHCLRRGDGRLRAALLGELLELTGEAVARGAVPPAHLAALRRLAIEDAAAAGDDPMPLIAGQVGRCFHGRLPLAFAEHLLDGWGGDWWTRGNVVRLRVLLCDQAFEAGFEVRNLLDAGQTAPALGRVLDTGRPTYLAALRLLWSLRASQPWDTCGPSLTAFDLAADRQRARLLGKYPDLLLLQEEPNWPPLAGADAEAEPARIVLCSRGVFLQDMLFTSEPPPAEVVLRGGSTDVAFGTQRFRARGRLEALAPRMERWFRYAFKEFLPRLSEVKGWQPPERAALLRAWGAVPCPECRRPLLARVGEAGLAFDEVS